MKLLSWIVLLPIAALVIVFAVVNRELTTLSLWPLPFEVDLPLFSVIFGGTLIGVLWGGVAAWSAAGTTRTKARERAREIQRLNDENRRLKGQVETFEREARERNRGAAALTDDAENGGGATKALTTSSSS